MKKFVTIMLLCVVLLAAPLSAAAATVMIDPGHGGSDPGAIGVTGLYEKEVNLDISLMVRDDLERRGYRVLMTRTEDVFLSLQERIEIAEREKPDILVSIHANAFHTPDVAGTVVLYYDSRYPVHNYPASEAMVRLSPESRKLAESLLKSAVQASGSLDRGLLQSSVYMVRMGSVPSALIETAFLSNPEDEAKLRDPEFREKMAIGIADGIVNYLPLHFSDVAGHWAKDSVMSLHELGVVEGNGQYYFPDRTLTRAEFLAILDRSISLPAKEDQADEPAEDVDEPLDEQADESGAVSDLEEVPSAAPDASDDDGRWNADRDRANGELNEQDDDTRAGADGQRRNRSSSGAVSAESIRTYADDEAGLEESEIMNPGSEAESEESGNTDADAQPEESENLDSDSSREDDPDVEDEHGEDMYVPEFTDLSKDHWAYEPIVKAVQSGLIEGFLDGSIRPDDPISRAEVTVIMDRLLNSAVYEQEPAERAGREQTEEEEFVDVPRTEWYAEAVYRLKDKQIINGVSSTLFAPDKTMSRAEAAVMVDRYIHVAMSHFHIV